MIRNDKKNQQFTISDNSVYNRDETIKLIKIILDYGLQMEGYSKSGSAVKAIYFNDNEVISEFMNYKGYSNQIVKYSKGHDNHIHLELNLPDRILNGAPDYIDCVENLPIDEENTPNGLAKVPSGELIKSSDKIKYLGKI
jgi:hypothetical protein